MFEKKQKFTLSINPVENEGEELFFNSEQVEDFELTQEEEGQLSIDIVQDQEKLIIIATMSGTKPENIELHLHNDLLTIRGYRESPASIMPECLLNENYWGRFSRTIVLPVDVKAELAQAEYRNGVLSVILPKKQEDKNIPIFVVDE